MCYFPLKLLLIFFVTNVLMNNVYGEKPHIVYILADDLGWNDVGFHGLNDIPTPNIDALALSGLPLHNYYVTPICTPSRSALMTAKYPIHNGMQHTVLYPGERRGLPLNETILPQYLKRLGYKNHLVGKWHLGFYKKEFTPLYRGFDSHLGFWTGRIDLFDHSSSYEDAWGFDFRRGMDVAWDLFGQYATDVYAKESVKIVMEHDKKDPLFLLIAHSAVHSGNPYEPLRSPYGYEEQFEHIKIPARRKFAGMLKSLDDSVGQVIEALSKRDMLKDTIVVFSTDNGGPAANFNMNAASNYPLKGVKNTLCEGGVRGAGFLWLNKNRSSYNKSKPKIPRKSTQMMHISDWLPTLYKAAGGDLKDLHEMDGLNLWDALLSDEPSPRHEILHNIDDIYGSASLTIEHWKVMKGTNYGGAYDKWYGPGGREVPYKRELLYKSKTAKALDKLDLMPPIDSALKLRNDMIVKCNTSVPVIECKPLVKPCLFNILYDPCEQRNLADIEREKLNTLLNVLDDYNKTAKAPSNLPNDPQYNPKYWNHIYINFGDYEHKVQMRK